VPKRNTLVALVLTGSLLLAACGDDDEDASTTTTAAATTSTAAATTTTAKAGDIVAVATSAGSFTKLTAALKAADLVITLQGTGPFTVFAPTDAAFAALPPGLLDKLLLPQNKDVLKRILLFHVISGSEVPSSKVAAGDVAMASGDTAKIVVSGSTITIADAKITAVDVDASNGVIHVIDKVMVPAGVNLGALLAG
jgi:uncharacterized surface protein with fasciclin (FAS1) repeats